MFILQRFKSLIFVGLCHFPLQKTEAFMKKKLFLLAGLLGLINFSIAQTVVYNEDFDGASISGSCTSRGGGTGFPVVTPVAPGAWCWNEPVLRLYLPLILTILKRLWLLTPLCLKPVLSLLLVILLYWLAFSTKRLCSEVCAQKFMFQ